MSSSDEVDVEGTMNVLERTLDFLNDDERFGRYVTALTEKGWDLSVAALETRSGRRIVV